MFYDELKKQILDLVNNKEFDKALTIIAEELKVPYVPPDFEIFLKETKRELENNFEQSKKRSQSGLSIDVLLQKLKSSKLAEQIWAIMNLENFNLRPYLKNIENYLLREDAPGDFKTMLLINLYNQQIPNKLKVWKDYQTFEIVPVELKVARLITFLEQSKKNISKHNWTKNMTYETLANKLLLIFLFNRFPKDFDFLENDLIATVYKKTIELLGESITWTDLENHFVFNKQKAQNLLGELDKDLEESMVND